MTPLHPPIDSGSGLRAGIDLGTPFDKGTAQCLASSRDIHKRLRDSVQVVDQIQPIIIKAIR
jgi:hypothetical protein